MFALSPSAAQAVMPLLHHTAETRLEPCEHPKPVQCACGMAAAGLLYLRMGTSLPTDLSDRVSSLWFSLAIIMFTPSFTALVVWDKERLLLRRESATGARCRACTLLALGAEAHAGSPCCALDLRSCVSRSHHVTSAQSCNRLEVSLHGIGWRLQARTGCQHFSARRP